MNYEYLELAELRKLLDEKKVSSVELTKYFLARIKELDPKLNSFITVVEEEALQAAQEATLNRVGTLDRHVQEKTGAIERRGRYRREPNPTR
jgi:Asp-tRNA(Asn)/Glu-tRNA(Gln) amidotransferase A subunit family amidase